jgi:hypothetical protein
MKNKLVIWGTDAQDKKVLIALELRPTENKVDIFTFQDADLTEVFVQEMQTQWQSSKKEIVFLDPHQHIVRDLTVSESLLPDDLRTEKTEAIATAQREWHFLVLSHKLSDVYRSELNNIKTKMEGLTQYQPEIWKELKGFWDKLISQVKEKNIIKDHADELIGESNQMFEHLKVKRSEMDAQLSEVSAKAAATFSETLEAIHERINKGMRLAPIFDELKELQEKYKKTQMLQKDRDVVWDKINKAFTALKEKKYGSSNENTQNQNNFGERMNSRIGGLLDAIDKMETSLNRDKQDLTYESKRIDNSTSQLEAQLRTAKLSMIEARISSKEEKLKDMYKTKAEIESKIESNNRRAEQQAKLDEAKNAIKSKIAGEIQDSQASHADEAADLEKAAAALKASKIKKAPKEESLVDAIMEVAGDSLRDMVDTVKAVASVVEDKISEAFDKEPKEEELVEASQNKVETPEVVTPEVVVENTKKKDNTEDDSEG